MYRISKIGLALLLLGAIGLSAGLHGASAAEDAANVIKYRKQVMTANAAHITAIFSVVKGETSYSGHIAAHARAIAAGAAMIPDIFPEGSDTGNTAAKPEIWQDWAKFEAAARALDAAAVKLADAAEGGDMAAIGARAGDVGKACGGCHEPFRKKK